MTPDWTTTIGAVASVIAAVTGVITVASGSIRAAREAKRVAAARWTMELRLVQEGFLGVGLRYDVGDTQGVTLRSLRIVSPRGLKFCDYTDDHDPEKPMKARTMRIGTSRFRKCFFNMDLRRQAGIRDSVRTIVEVPRKPAWTRAPLMRVRIEIRAEERAASRKAIVVIVAGPEVPWAEVETS